MVIVRQVMVGMMEMMVKSGDGGGDEEGRWELPFLESSPDPSRDGTKHFTSNPLNSPMR